MKSPIPYSTGLESLDQILNSLQIGDNVVWQVDSIKDYRQFTLPFVKRALEEERSVNYMRFGSHEAVIDYDERIKVHVLDAYHGFETFSKQVYNIITREGENAYYVFDCLSDLLAAWATDLMIGNFFAITCPYLYELNTIAYFAIMRDSHSFKTIARIREITQLLIDAYDCEGNCYVHPLKVLNRYSPTMFFPHLKKGDRFVPTTRSEDATQFISCIQRSSREKTRRNLDFWDRLFLSAEKIVEEPSTLKERQDMVDRLCKQMIGREDRILSLAGKTLSLESIVEVKDRMIGTGYIGGKAAGMLLARNILRNDTERDWNETLEPHDSFYIGSDVFYTYIVQNGWWKLFMEQRTEEGYFRVAGELREKMLKGFFPEETKEQFQQMIEYFGQSPIIVRSSSLLEDSYGNAFAGKYDSFFCVNQGTPAQRYQKFVQAVQRIYASTMDEDALTYRLQRGLGQLDEQMALLVMRVSGTQHGRYFFPDIGGVGFSCNNYVWKHGMDPDAGMLRLVFGLGTRAVNRVEGDYPRIVALDDPLLKPLSDMDDMRRFSQHNVDILNIEANELQTVPFTDLQEEEYAFPMPLVGTRDTLAIQRMREMGLPGDEAWILTFDELLTSTPFPKDMNAIMKRLERLYDYPVDIEFTVNFSGGTGYRINLLQCRPQQTKGIEKKVEIPEDLSGRDLLFTSQGNFLGGSISQHVSRLIYVHPQRYSDLSIPQKYDIARLIGRLNKLVSGREETKVILLGPGRWGTTTPSLGVPVRFAEINNISVMVEIALMSDNVLPELSFGTHFFQDLVETDIFYIALFPERSGVRFYESFIDASENILTGLMPGETKYADVVKVVDFEGEALRVMADIISQRVVCFR